MTPPLKLVLLRHGQTLWNKQHRSTGWANVGLTPTGEQQALAAGKVLAASGFKFDEAYTSQLQRAQATLDLVLSAMQCAEIPIHQQWRLNERHCGAFEGLGPISAVLKYGLWQFIQCQRRFDVAPPPLELDDPRFPGNQARFEDIPRDDLPRSESLQQTWQRVRPVWEGQIAPGVKAGRRLLVVAHKNTLGELIKQIVGEARSRSAHLSIRTGRPMVYELNADLELIRNYVIKK